MSSSRSGTPRLSVSNTVLDASALLALLYEETGREVTAGLIAAGGAAISAVNLSEVVARRLDTGTPQPLIEEVLRSMDLEVVPFDGYLAYRAGSLRPLTRHLGLSLGDRACLALAQQLNVPVYTADRAWANLQLGIPIHLIR